MNALETLQYMGDRVQIAVTALGDVVRSFESLFDAEVIRTEHSKYLGAKKTVLSFGESEILPTRSLPSRNHASSLTVSSTDLSQDRSHKRAKRPCSSRFM